MIVTEIFHRFPKTSHVYKIDFIFELLFLSFSFDDIYLLVILLISVFADTQLYFLDSLLCIYLMIGKH